LRGSLCGAMSAEAEMFELERDLLENVIALHIAGSGRCFVSGRCAGSGHGARMCEARLHTLEAGLALPQ
jgi:hypothetical protein